MTYRVAGSALLSLFLVRTAFGAPVENTTLTWTTAVAMALENNPTLAASRTEIKVQAAEALQAGLRPNPVATAEFEDIGGTGSRSDIESGEVTHSISQVIELAGKRDKRRLAAELEKDVATAAYDVRRREVVVETAKAFADVMLKQRRLVLANELVEVADAAIQSVSATVKSGAVSPVEQDRAVAAAARARADVATAQGELNVARAALAATWGSVSPQFSRVDGALEPLEPPPALPALMQQAESSPQVRRFDAEVAQRGATLDLESAKAVPDLTLSAGTRQYQDGRDFAFVLGFSVPIPLFDRNQGNTLAAAHRVFQTLQEREAAKNNAQAQLRQAHDAMSASYTRAELLRASAIPAAEKAYRGAKDAYTRGLFRYLEVLDAQRTVFDLRASYLDALESYHRAAVEIARWEMASPREGVIR